MRRPERKYAIWFIAVVNAGLVAFIGSYLAWSWTRPVRYVWDSDFDWWLTITFGVALVITNVNFFSTNRRAAKTERYFANHPQLEDVRRSWRYN